MNNLGWELSVLCRAVEYLNLSAAAAHIGISQPQLSRIVAKIEAELGFSLLDRAVRRHAAWTSEARKLAKIYQRADRGLKAEITGMRNGARLTRIAIGCLEGLLDVVVPVAQTLIKKIKPETLELDIYDINDLETLFLNGTLDVIFTGREIIRRKPRLSKVIGTQTLDWLGSSTSDTTVSSHYEYNRTSSKKTTRKKTGSNLLSNSLLVRKLWIERNFGAGVIPSKLRPLDSKIKSGATQVPVYLFGSENLSDQIWKIITQEI